TDRQGFRHGGLDVIDVVAVPDRLEQSIGEPQNENVLDRFLSEVVIDAIELVLVEDIEQVVIELARRREIRAERLLDDDPTPGAVFLARETRSSELAVDEGIALGSEPDLDHGAILAACVKETESPAI